MDEEELTEEIVEKIIEIIENESYVNDYGDEMVFVDVVVDSIRGWFGL